MLRRVEILSCLAPETTSQNMSQPTDTLEHREQVTTWPLVKVYLNGKCRWYRKTRESRSFRSTLGARLPGISVSQGPATEFRCRTTSDLKNILSTQTCAARARTLRGKSQFTKRIVPRPISAPGPGNSRASAFPELRIFPSQEVVPRKLPSWGASCELACRHCERESITIPAEDIRMSRVSECTLKLCLPLRGRSSPVCAHLLQVQFAICPVAQLYSVHLAAAITRIK